ncbi:MAG: hypothetical protein HYV09_37520 [Deltaproteobacteria bacterium]|nr:hypothetical protein [Deltaproteobacteria bacterium]
MLRVGIAVLVLTTLGCRRAPAPTTEPLLSRYPIRAHVRWTENMQRGGELSVRRREERWTKVAPDTWDVLTRDTASGADARPFRARYALLPAGLAQVAVLEGERVLPVTPPKIALPTGARPGLSWGDEHDIDGHLSRRTCRLVAYDACADGLEEQCTTSFADGRVVEVHNRWCGRVGQVGYASTTRKAGHDDVVRIWSEDLADVRD